MTIQSKIGIATAVCLGLATLLAITRTYTYSTTTARVPCMDNLRQIDGAKQQWALENNVTDQDTAPTMADIRVYLGRGSQGEIPVCPQGGTYTPGRLKESPTCSYGQTHCPPSHQPIRWMLPASLSGIAFALALFFQLRGDARYVKTKQIRPASQKTLLPALIVALGILTSLLLFDFGRETQFDPLTHPGAHQLPTGSSDEC